MQFIASQHGLSHESTCLYLAQFSLALVVQHHISPAPMTSTLFSDVLFLRDPLLFRAMSLDVWYLQSYFIMRSTWPSHWCCTFFTIASVWLRAVLMSSFLISSMMRTPSIFLSAAISNTSSCFSSALLSVHASQPYKAICTISFWSRSWCFWFFQMLFKSLITSKAVAVLILMSVEQSQFYSCSKFLESFHML